MNSEEFKRACISLCEFIIQHKNTNKDTQLNIDQQPGDMSCKLDKFNFSENAKPFDIIFNHFINDIYPNTLNWQHPLFLGYYPSCNSYPSILGEMLSAGLGTIGLTWKSCPALTELELYCIHQIIHLMKVPFASGNILSSASEAVLISMITAVHITKERDRSRLCVYASDLTHSCVYKAASILQLNMRNIPVRKSTWEMDTIALEDKINEDIKNGLVPIYTCATFGTTSLCSIDDIEQIGKICKKYKIYLHVDAAYAGSTLFIRKYRQMIKGIHHADSMNINCNKLMLINYDCTLALYKDTTSLVNALSSDPPYLNSEFNRIDLRNYDISLSRRFRSLKLWFTIHSYGLSGIRRHIRRTFRYAAILSSMIKILDKRIEIINHVKFGLVCFRIKNSNTLTNTLYTRLCKYVNMYLTNSSIYNTSFIRISVNNIKSRTEIKEIVNKIIKCTDSIMGIQDGEDSEQKINQNIKIHDQLKNSFNNVLNQAVNAKINTMLYSGKVQPGRQRRKSISNITKVDSEFIKQFVNEINNDPW